MSDKSRRSNPDADKGWLRKIGWSGWTRSADESWTRQKELTKPVGYSGNLLLDGEFNSPPPPPGNLTTPAVKRQRFFVLEMTVGGREKRIHK